MDAWRQPPLVWGQWPYHRQVASSWARSTDIPKDPLSVGQSGGRADALGTPGCQCARWGECWQARWPGHHPGSQGTNSARDPVGVLHCCSHGVCEITGDGRRPACEARSPAVEVQWWWPILERDAGVDAGDGGGDPSALSTGQSSAAVPVGRLSRAWGAGRGRGGGGSSERRPGRNPGVNASLPNLFEASQFTLRGIKLDTLPSPALLPQSITTNAYHCQFRVLARL